MFNNNINKPAITVFLPLTSAFILPAKTIFAGTVFSAEKKRFLPVTGKNLTTLPSDQLSAGWWASDQHSAGLLASDQHSAGWSMTQWHIVSVVAVARVRQLTR